MSRALARDDIASFETKCRRSTDRLLSVLREHHDYSIPAPIAPPPPVVEPPKPELVTDEWVARQWPAVVDELGPMNRKTPSIQEIISACARHFQMSKTQLLAHRRAAQVVYPRHIAMYLASTLTERSLPEIGRKLGGRDHTTIMYGVRKIEATLRTNWLVAFDVAHVEAML